MTNDLNNFYEDYQKMTNIELVHFIDEYGEHKFFIDLYKNFWNEFSVNVSIGYHKAKQYFIEH
jgi:hypothetical protein